MMWKKEIGIQGAWKETLFPSALALTALATGMAIKKELVARSGNLVVAEKKKSPTLIIFSLSMKQLLRAVPRA